MFVLRCQILCLSECKVCKRDKRGQFTEDPTCITVTGIQDRSDNPFLVATWGATHSATFGHFVWLRLSPFLAQLHATYCDFKTATVATVATATPTVPPWLRRANARSKRLSKGSAKPESWTGAKWDEMGRDRKTHEMWRKIRQLMEKNGRDSRRDSQRDSRKLKVKGLQLGIATCHRNQSKTNPTKDRNDLWHFWVSVLWIASCLIFRLFLLSEVDVTWCWKDFGGKWEIPD